MAGISMSTQDSVMKSQLKTFKDAINTRRVYSVREPTKSTQVVIEDLHKSREFQRVCKYIETTRRRQ